MESNISFILVEPRELGNISASARAMKNMGFQHLELVKPLRFVTDEAKKMACNAFDILAKAETYGNLNDALKAKTLVVGTTGRFGKTRGLILPLEEGIKNDRLCQEEQGLHAFWERGQRIEQQGG